MNYLTKNIDENVNKLAKMLNQINEYQIIISNNKIFNNENIINIKVLKNNIKISITEYTRAFINVIINYEIKPEILEKLKIK